MNDYLASVTTVQKVFSSGHGVCRHEGCSFKAPGADDVSPELINHYIKAHGYRILHIGTETYAETDHVQMYTVTTLGYSGDTNRLWSFE